MLDMHVHVWTHQPGTPTPTFDQLARYCEVAAARGVEQIAITEHAYRFTRMATDVLPHWERPRSGPVADATEHAITAEQGGDLDAYIAALVDAKARGLPLLVGLEVDHLPGTTVATSEVLADYPLDVVLGSVHWLDEWLFDAYGTAAFAQRWAERDVDDVYAQYVDEILLLAQSGLVDVLAHLDVIKVAGHNPQHPGRHHDRLVDGLLSSPAGRRLVIEVSSNGWSKPAGEPYPAPALLARLVAGGMRVTTASDAHVPDRVGERFDDLRSCLADAGVTELVSFDRRTPVVRAI